MQESENDPKYQKCPSSFADSPVGVGIVGK
jgi:hypothetical protein